MRATPVISSFADAVAVVVRTLEQELPGSAIWIGHLDGDRSVLRVVAAGGDASFELEAGAEAPLETSYCQVMASGAGGRLAPDVAQDPAYALLPATSALGVRSFTGAPLTFADGTPVGTLCAFHREPGAFTMRELGLIGAFSAFLSRELEHERRHADHAQVIGELRRLATTDALTGLANRRAFRAELNRRWERARDTGSREAVALLDLDDFKRVNDRDGHLEGDRVLVAVAQAIRAACGPDDVVARLGGDEFGVLLAGDPIRWRTDLRERLARDRRGVRVSVGHVELARAASPEAALASADMLLYAEKRGGGRHAA
jgi:diguanylate cyclase